MLFLVMFILDWFSVGGQEGDLADAAGIDTGGNAWQVFSLIDLLMLLTIIVTVGLAVMAATSQSANLPVAGSAVVTVLGDSAFWSSCSGSSRRPTVASRSPTSRAASGSGSGSCLAIGITAGGWLSMQEEGASFSGEADRLQGGGGSGRGNQPPPPPPPNR